jgi:hypothetical protein
MGLINLFLCKIISGKVGGVIVTATAAEVVENDKSAWGMKLDGGWQFKLFWPQWLVAVFGQHGLRIADIGAFRDAANTSFRIF